MKVLIAVDGSAHTKQMLAYLAKHEKLLGDAPELTVLTVHAPLPGFASRTVGKQVVDDYHKEESEAVLAPVTEFLSSKGFRFNAIRRTGPVAAEIIAQANDSAADLIVMGAHGREGLGAMLLGSVTQKVLATSPVPVLVIR